jgi:ASC-1-like (ASCH) protein
MAVHVAILMRQYIRLILDGTKTVESRLTRTSRAPFRRVSPGDVIYFRQSCGPYLAQAIAGEVTFHEDLKPADIEALKSRWNAMVCGDDAYWAMKKDSRYATFIRLKQVTPTDHGPAMPPSNGLAWFVLADGAASTFEVTLSAGAIRNRYVAVPRKIHRFPDGVYGGRTAAETGESIELLLPDGRIIGTDICSAGGMLRWRGWRSCFEDCGVKAGWRVRFEALSAGRYRVSFHEREG